MTTILPLQTSERLRGGLESVARPPVGRDGQVVSESEWRGGVGFTPLHGHSDQGFVWPVGCAATPALTGGKPTEDPIGPMEEFQPLVVGAISSCLPGRTVFGDLQRAQALEVLERVKYGKLSEALLTGGTGASNESNPGLLATATMPAGFDAANPNTVRLTMQGLLNGVCDAGGSDWVFHAPIQALPTIKEALGLTWNGERGVWTYGPFDWSFDCYPNVGPASVEGTNPTATDGSEWWIWLTRRPMIAWSDSTQVVEATKALENERKVLAEQVALLVFDTGAVYGAKAAVA